MEYVLSIVHEYVGFERGIRTRVAWARGANAPTPFVSVADVNRFMRKRQVLRELRDLFKHFRDPGGVLAACKFLRTRVVSCF
jgi:hypothetical protein